MNVVAVVQARMGSTRFPNKVMQPIQGRPMIELLISRLQKSRQVHKIVLATSDDPKNQALVEWVAKLGIQCVAGSEDDVLARYLAAARASEADVIVRITGDCPLVDPVIVDDLVSAFTNDSIDYISNTNPPTFPDGLDVEVFSVKALEVAGREATDKYDREHVTPYLRKQGLFRTRNVRHTEDLSNLRWTVDEIEDFKVVVNVFNKFHPAIDFGWRDVLKYQRQNPEEFSSNSGIRRNEGAIMGTGAKLWKRAKKIIPGGNMLLSKRPEMFLPEKWPAYFSRAKGCYVWDMDGIRYTDVSIMGIGTNILGYGRKEIDEAVGQTVCAGNMSTLNCPEEVYLAEKLVEIHPWANMVRFARTGGEANAVAIRIARAASGRSGVAICGYHGWHDWYLAANLGDAGNLEGHLLPGLDPKGVPENLKGTVFPFQYNKIDELEAIVSNHKIGIIKMEVMRNKEPENCFLQKVRDIASKNRIVLIFDECTSGFRETYGGLHKKYGVEPDIAMFGKALGNGYAITAVIGRREVMEAAQNTFISSTFWTERIGPTAGLKTLEVMEEAQSWVDVTMKGLQVKKRWQDLADRNSLKISHWGIPALAGFTIESVNALAYKTLITQEMLRKNFLAANCIYISTEHSQDVLDSYFDNLTPVFKLIAECESGRPVGEVLTSAVCHSGFKRLN
jgi:glutamate-1-semialdehyde 2,1-aminomutase